MFHMLAHPAGEHDWVNPSEDLLATLRGELDLDLRDAPDDSDEGVSRGGTTAGPVKKCRPWHWLKEMRYAIYTKPGSGTCKPRG